MSKQDLEIYREVRGIWLTATGISITTRATVWMLDALVEGFGEEFSLEKACEGLRDLSKTALAIEGNLLEKAGDTAH